MQTVKKGNGFIHFKISSGHHSSTSPKQSPKKLEQAYTLMKKGEFEKAKPLYEEIVKGNSCSEALLGLAVIHLRGDHSDHRLAFGYIREAAHLNNSEAIYMMGFMYKRGYGVPQNMSRAAEHFARIKDIHPGAMVELGKQYYYGEGVNPDIGAAFACFSKGAQEDFPRAQRYLGIFYLKQGDIDRDDREALYAKALECFQSPLLKDDPKTLYYLGLIYLEGLGVPKNTEIAKEYLTIAAAAEDTFAQNVLGEIAKEEGDVYLALDYFKTAASRNNARALCNLGKLYETGYRGVIDVNLSLAAEHYSQAALFGEPTAAEPLKRIAKCFALGKGVEMNRDLAESYYGDANYLNLTEKEHALHYAHENIQKAKKFLEYEKIERALACFENARDLFEAQVALANFYRKCYLDKQENLELALKWIKFATDTGAIAPKNYAEVFSLSRLKASSADLGDVAEMKEKR